MNKKLIIVAVVIIVIVAVGIVWFVVQNHNSSSGNGTSTTTETLPVASTSVPIVAVPTPTSTVITLGTSQGVVTVNNFYQGSGATITQDKQAVIIQDTGDYVITYNVPDSSFSIALLSTPLETARQAAEATFLSELGISQADACKLTVYEGVPIGVSGQYPGESFPLSFCGGPPTL